MIGTTGARQTVLYLVGLAMFVALILLTNSLLTALIPGQDPPVEPTEHQVRLSDGRTVLCITYARSISCDWVRQ
jgi:hypothetical protein